MGVCAVRNELRHNRASGTGSGTVPVVTDGGTTKSDRLAC